MTRLTERIGKASFWVASTRGFVNLLSLASTVILARLLVPADFGLVAAGTAILTILMAITDISMAQALIAHRDPTRDHLDTAWTLGILRGLVLGGILVLAAPLVAAFFGDSRLTKVLWVFSFGILLTGLANPRRIMLQKDLIFWQDFVLQVTSRLVALIVSVVIAFYYKSYWALVVGQVAGQFMSVILSYTILPFLPRFSLRHVRDLLGFSVWLTMQKLVNNLNWRLDTLLLGKFLGTGILGIYSMGNNLASMPVRESTQPLSAALFPAFVAIRDNPERLRAAYQRVQSLLFTIALPVGFGMAMVSDLLVDILLGEKWRPAVQVIQVISIVAALQSFQRPMEALAMSLGSTRLLFWRSTQLLALRVPFIIAGIYFGGLQGLLYARAFTGTCSVFASAWYVRQMIGLKISEQIFRSYRVFIAVSVMIGLMALCRSELGAMPPGYGEIIGLILCLALGALTYLGVLFLLWYMQGKPKGGEQELIAGLKTLMSRLAALRGSRGKAA